MNRHEAERHKRNLELLERMKDNHTHSLDLPNFIGTSGTAGTGTTQGNVQPTIILNYVIKY